MLVSTEKESKNSLKNVLFINKVGVTEMLFQSVSLLEGPCNKYDRRVGLSLIV